MVSLVKRARTSHNMPDLSIIILTYNSQDSIEECLQSLKTAHQNELKSGKIELVISDNSSTDKTRQLTESFLKKNNIKSAKLFKSKNNVGFAKGINEAVKKTSAEYVLFLNPDASLLEDSSLIKMKEFMQEENSRAICSGKLYYSNKRVEKNANKEIGVAYIVALMLALDEKLGFRFSPNSPQEVCSVSGGFMMVKKEAFEKLKGFDTDYFMYFEDIDLCKRAREHNFSVNFYPYAKAKHEEHGSSDRGYAIVNIYKGLSIYTKKHHNTLERNMIKFMLATKALVAIASARATQNRKLQETYTKALSALL